MSSDTTKPIELECERCGDPNHSGAISPCPECKDVICADCREAGCLHGKCPYGESP